MMVLITVTILSILSILLLKLLTYTRCGIKYSGVVIITTVTLAITKMLILGLGSSETHIKIVTFLVAIEFISIIFGSVILVMNLLMEEPEYKFMDMISRKEYYLDSSVVVVRSLKDRDLRAISFLGDDIHGYNKSALNWLTEKSPDDLPEIPLKNLPSMYVGDTKSLVKKLNESYRWELAKVMTMDQFRSHYRGSMYDDELIAIIDGTNSKSSGVRIIS